MSNIGREIGDLECKESGPAAATVLYVEDNASNLKLVSELLARRGNLTLLSATDGLAGVAMAIEMQPTIILMDIHLPGISGNDALRLLKAEARTAHIPVIALSSDAFPNQIDAALKAGFFRYLTKPFVFAEFLGALDAALHSAAAQ